MSKSGSGYGEGSKGRSRVEEVLKGEEERDIRGILGARSRSIGLAKGVGVGR